MLIVCPSCATAYNVDLPNLPAGGRQVRCVRCRTVWHAQPSEPSRADRLMAAAEAIAPEASEAHGFAGFSGQDTAAEHSGHSGDWNQSDGENPEFPVVPYTDDEPPGDGTWDAAAEAPSITPEVGDDQDLAAEPGRAAAMDSPSIVPVDLDGGRPPPDTDHDRTPEPPAEPLEDIETYAVRRAGPKPRHAALRWPLSQLQTGILVLLILDAVLIGWRGRIVRVLPQTASFYAMLGMPVNLRGLVFDSVATSSEQHEGVPILVVQGDIVNDTRQMVEVPRIRFAVRNRARQEVYSWTAVPTKTVLPPGEALAFHTRLASPPTDSQDVLVRFLNRRDILAGAR